MNVLSTSCQEYKEALWEKPRKKILRLFCRRHCLFPSSCSEQEAGHFPPDFTLGGRVFQENFQEFKWFPWNVRGTADWHLTHSEGTTVREDPRKSAGSRGHQPHLHQCRATTASVKQGCVHTLPSLPRIRRSQSTGAEGKSIIKTKKI